MQRLSLLRGRIIASLTRRVARRWAMAVLAALIAAAPAAAWACPFCTALRPTLCEQREQAAVALLGEYDREEEGARRFTVHQAFSGKERLAGATSLVARVEWKGEPGALVLLFGEGNAASGLADLTWTAVSVDETSLAYFAAAPSLRKPAAERLKYFAARLEHPNATIAEDVYQEFGHAPLADIVKVAHLLPQEKLRAWLMDRDIPQERKGFFAVALAVAPRKDDRTKNIALLEKVLADRTTDFRAGFDGAIGAYLLLRGEAGLAEVAKRFLADPKAAEGDVRHAMTAVRFFYEHDRSIDRARFHEAFRPLLARAQFAAMAAIDLARWKDWQSLPKIVSLYAAAGYPQPATRDAVVAYLSACPEKAAAEALGALRKQDPEGVAAAEFKLGKPPVTKQ